MMTTFKGIQLNHGVKGAVALDSSALPNFCTKNKISLPEDYLAFLRATNGGKPFYPNNEVYIRCDDAQGKMSEKEIYAFHPFIMHQSYSAQPSIWRVGNLKRPKFLFEIACGVQI